MIPEKSDTLSIGRQAVVKNSVDRGQQRAVPAVRGVDIWSLDRRPVVTFIFFFKENLTRHNLFPLEILLLILSENSGGFAFLSTIGSKATEDTQKSVFNNMQAACCSPETTSSRGST